MWNHRVNLKQACLTFDVLQGNSKKISIHGGINIYIYIYQVNCVLLYALGAVSV